MEPTSSENVSAGCVGLEIPQNIEDLLPPGYCHHICSLEDFSDGSFDVTIRLKTTTKDAALDWLTAFQASSYCTWKVRQTFPTAGKYVIFKKGYRCHHNTRPKPGANKNRRIPSKNTDCPAKMLIRVQPSNKLSRNKTDPHLPEYPTTVVLEYLHNHTIYCADALKYRDVSPETREKLIALFHNRHGPTTAIESIKCDLQLKHGDKYFMAAADRAICPDLGYCCRLYTKTFCESYGESKGEAMLSDLKKLANQYNSETASSSMAVDITSDEQVIVAICTPLMQRVHTLHGLIYLYEFLFSVKSRCWIVGTVITVYMLYI